MIRVNVFIEVAEAHRAEMLKLAQELTAFSSAEEGCTAYDIFESATRKHVLMICETWQTQEDLTAHEKTVHFNTIVPRMSEIAAKMKVEKFLF